MQDIFPLDFWKMSGAGNDFIVIDHRHHHIPVAEQPEFARLVCRRMFSVGADGLIFIEPPVAPDHDFSWRFYNSDGSEAAMCGNGSRCAARFAFAHGIAGEHMRFATLAGIVQAEMVTEMSVRVFLPTPQGFRHPVEVEVGDRRLSGGLVTVGVPHLVLFPDGNEVSVVGWGRQARMAPQFQPDGVNVNFVRLTEGNRIYVRTYERGVENETMACGTGAAASVICAAAIHGLQPPVTVKTSGGEELTINFATDSSGEVTQVTLEGAARLIYHGSLTAEALN
ncbi:MAG: diaminopimelate epimerase [Desulfobulbaceae bacterium]|jgi:diaminopimelate epimerase|nr:diaminopimelate epimerase [Desulfobulbaceae bacterium]